jgi:hypothetical protein
VVAAFLGPCRKRGADGAGVDEAYAQIVPALLALWAACSWFECLPDQVEDVDPD